MLDVPTSDPTLVLARGLTAGAVAWVLLLLVAPAALGTESLATAGSYLYVAGSRICHQLTARSFAFEGAQLPVCARCFGLYSSGALGAALAWSATAGPMPWARVALLVAAIPTGVTWGLEAAGLAGFSNLARAVAALPLGGAAGWVFVQMLRYDAKSNGRENHHRRPAARLG